MDNNSKLLGKPSPLKLLEPGLEVLLSPAISEELKIPILFNNYEGFHEIDE
jgi:hypothetical protein